MRTEVFNKPAADGQRPRAIDCCKVHTRYRTTAFFRKCIGGCYELFADCSCCTTVQRTEEAYHALAAWRHAMASGRVDTCKIVLNMAMAAPVNY
eukprot:SAG31_NODE_194_length_20722_cov_19.854192_27_plen_93_part_01